MRLHLTKRDFIKTCGRGLSLFSAIHLFGLAASSPARTPSKGFIREKQSPFFTPLPGLQVQCELCPKRCIVPEDKRGYCGVRRNRDGKLYTLVYGNPCAVHLEPIEKKPFLHVLPGSRSLSIATAGCNLHCKFCQNWEIAKALPDHVYNLEMPPITVVEKAREMGARAVACSYTEPAIFYEYMWDICRLSREQGLLSVIHSNGYISRKPLLKLCRVIDAAQIDLKGFTDAFYRDLCSGELKPVLETLKTLKREEVHLEITNLVIPTKNDDLSGIREMCLWIKNELGTDIPLHFSRFYPLYKLRRLPPTPVAILEKARHTALSAGLEYVYIGNVPGHEAWNTFCPRCGKVLIERIGYMIKDNRVTGGHCRYCGKPIPGIWL